jgi:hypothetical protein
MTKTLAKKHARSIAKSISNDDMTNWIDFTHIDGSQFLINECYFELIKNEDDEKGWFIIFTKFHGTMIYSEEDVVSWDGGSMDDDLDINESMALIS